MSYQNRTRYGLIVLIVFFAMLCFAALEKMAQAQTCTPPLFQGYPSSCSTINLRWLNRDAISLIDHYEIFRGSSKVGEAPASALSVSEAVGCGFGATYTIKQLMKSGANCQVITSNNPPHTKPCELCGTTGGGRLSTANGASFQAFLAADAIGTAFTEADFTTVTDYGFDSDPLTDGIQLPTEVGGVRAFIAGVQVGLFFVSPKQINFHVPKDMPLGLQQMTVATQSGNTITGDVVINRNSPGIFTAEQNGSGQAMALWFQFRNGIFFRIYPVGSKFDVILGDRLFLVMFATGVNAPRATLRINNRVYESLYSGNTPYFVGLDQLNFEIPLAELWNGSVGGQVTVWEPDGSSWLSNGFSVTGMPTR